MPCLPCMILIRPLVGALYIRGATFTYWVTLFWGEGSWLSPSTLDELSSERFSNVSSDSSFFILGFLAGLELPFCFLYPRLDSYFISSLAWFDSNMFRAFLSRLWESKAYLLSFLAFMAYALIYLADRFLLTLPEPSVSSSELSAYWSGFLKLPLS